MNVRAAVKPFFFDLTADEIREVQDATGRILASGNLILGEYTDAFERQFAEFIGVRHAVSVNTGSTALEILCRIKGVEGRTVLVPTNTNFASVASVLRCGGRVAYLDMDPATFAPTLDMVRRAVERTPDCAGVMWVHIGGVISAEFPDVVAWCRGRGLWVIEDACHAHGSALAAGKAGNLADGGAFSFFATKVMTTGEGGMITTNDANEAAAAQSLRNQGKRGVKFGGYHEDFGNSTRMTEMQCALGLIQLRKLPAMLERRAKAAAIVATTLDAAGVRHVSTRHMLQASQYKFIVLVPHPHDVAAVKRSLKERGVEVGGGVYDIPCHQQPVFKGLVPVDQYPAADMWCPRHICPPVTSGTPEDDARYVGEMLAERLS